MQSIAVESMYNICPFLNIHKSRSDSADYLLTISEENNEMFLKVAENVWLTIVWQRKQTFLYWFSWSHIQIVTDVSAVTRHMESPDKTSTTLMKKPVIWSHKIIIGHSKYCPSFTQTESMIELHFYSAG